MEKLHTHYDNLKVARNAPAEVIRAAYRVLAQKYHPDVNPRPRATEVMRILNDSRDVLLDPVRRAEHDSWIAEQELVKAEASEPPASSERTAQASRKAGSAPAPAPATSAPGVSLLARLNDYLSKLSSAGALALVITVIALAAGGAGMERRSQAAATADTSQDRLLSDEEFLGRASVPYVSDDALFTDEKPNRPSRTISRKGQSGTRSASQSPLGTPLADPDFRSKSGHTGPLLAAGGYSKVTVDNAQGDGDALVRLYQASSQTRVRSFLVKAGQSFASTNIAPGSYVMRYRFLGSRTVYEADTLIALEEERTESGIRYSNVSVTLFRVHGGNMRTREVPQDRF
ncbi:J domain-containing protein [Ramlibacter monticola]|uniref:J domain-containing protein n=1 Tax=Ramlibacter monticola TaxID=1926872 RepID=A0A937CX71_9BURK|nr:J domain-containing protein [Ramlibacter monticola]MBL0394277.1 J domain-containing protein [Ramlibacter monticola]